MIKRNLTLFKIDNFLGGMWLLCAVAVIFFEKITTSYVSAMLVFSIINLCQSIAEIPTGVISDKIGRKNSMIYGTFHIFLGYVLWAFAGYFQTAILLYIGSVFVGVGNAFLSGANDAFSYETITQMGQKDDFDKVFADNRSFDELGIVIGAICATVIYFYSSIELLAYLATIPAFLRFVVSFFYIEPEYISRAQHTFTNYIKISLKTIISSPKLLRFSLIKSINDSLNAVNWRFVGAYYQTIISTWLINVVRIFQEIIGYISYRLVFFVRKKNPKNVLFLSIFINALIKMLGVIINLAISPFIMASSTILYGISTTFENKILQQQLTDHERATIGSVLALWTAFLNTIIFLGIGLLADMFDVRVAIIIIMLGRIVVSILYRSIL